MRMSQSIDLLAGALCKAQLEIKDAVKSGVNPFYNNSQYATLHDVWSACRVQLSNNGLSVSQGFEMKETTTILCTMLMHSSGQWIESTLPLMFKENNSQSLKSSATLLRRAALEAIVGVASSDDDDGNKGSVIEQGQQSSEPGDFVINFTNGFKGKRIREVSVPELARLIEWCRGKNFAPDFVEAAESFLKK